MNKAVTELFVSTVDRHLEKGAKAVEKFQENVYEGNILYALKWADDVARDSAMFELWREVKRRYVEQGLTEQLALESVVNEVTDKLLKNFVVERSSSVLTTATSQMVAEGYAKFHEEATALRDAMIRHDS